MIIQLILNKKQQEKYKLLVAHKKTIKQNIVIHICLYNVLAPNTVAERETRKLHVICNYL